MRVVRKTFFNEERSGVRSQIQSRDAKNPKRRAHDTILGYRINAAFRSQVERRIYAAEAVPEEICPAPQSATSSNPALQPPLAPLLSAAYFMAKADTQKPKGNIWWQSVKTFGQERNPNTWRLARMNPCVSNPKSEIE